MPKAFSIASFTVKITEYKVSRRENADDSANSCGVKTSWVNSDSFFKFRNRSFLKISIPDPLSILVMQSRVKKDFPAIAAAHEFHALLEFDKREAMRNDRL